MKAATTNRTDPRFHFIGGKGGVGKTTCAAAFALARARAGKRVLVASTDPAPSLGDAFTVRLSASPRRVKAGPSASGRPGALHAVEIDAPAVVGRWIAERRSALEKIALEGTWLDSEDVAKLLGLSLPGIDEVASLLEVARLARTGRYDLVVVDTAPTGHTLRMLAMPATLMAVARVFDSMREKHRTMVAALRGEWRSDAEDALIESLAAEARSLDRLLRHRDRTRISWVTLPEAMAVAETSDAMQALEASGMTVSEIIVNRMTPAPPARCGHCDARRAYERSARRGLPPVRQVLVEARQQEPRGIRALAAIGADLAKTTIEPERRASSLKKWTAILKGRRIPMAALASRETRLLLFGGKGGVGKTTCAAAAALDAAGRLPDRRVLLTSIDPAHSLADAFGGVLTDDASRLRGAPSNLFVREMNAVRVMEGIRQRYSDAIEALFGRITGTRQFDAPHDRTVMQGLIDLAPPGLDELAAVIEITDALNGSDDLVILDTAPTGHALRLLEMPALVQDWTRALMAILLKYQAVTGLGELGALLLDLSKGLGRLRGLLADHRRTGFVVVTRGAALPRAETVRLLERLERLRVHVPAIVVNAVGRGRCPRCVKSAALEREEIFRLQRQAASKASAGDLVLAATQVPPPRTAAGLLQWQHAGWRYHQET